MNNWTSFANCPEGIGCACRADLLHHLSGVIVLAAAHRLHCPDYEFMTRILSFDSAVTRTVRCKLETSCMARFGRHACRD